jgi:hypothetical protein
MLLPMTFIRVEAQLIASESEYPTGYPSPYPTVEVGARCVKDLVDEHYSDGMYVWATLEQTDGDLEIDTDAVLGYEGEIVAWADHLLTEFGLAEILGIAGCDVLDWSIREGIAPGQPFLIYCTPPVTIRSYEGEYDIDWEAWIVRRMPTTMELRQYERVVSEVYADREMQRMRRAARG